jgi:C-terminal processing protease CtpA/Prc
MINPGSVHYSGKVAILVDETSQSQAEYTAMALRAMPNSIVVGSTTAGADGDVSLIHLPGQLSTLISGLGVFYPDHRPTQRVGIVPDVVARPTIRGIAAGRDEVLKTAVHLIENAK